jgi:hypothetical protein
MIMPLPWDLSNRPKPGLDDRTAFLPTILDICP